MFVSVFVLFHDTVGSPTKNQEYKEAVYLDVGARGAGGLKLLQLGTNQSQSGKFCCIERTSRVRANIALSRFSVKFMKDIGLDKIGCNYPSC